MDVVVVSQAPSPELNPNSLTPTTTTMVGLYPTIQGRQQARKLPNPDTRR